MVSFNVYLSGSEIADALSDDEEELSRCLEVLSQTIVNENHINDFGQVIADSANDSEKVALWLMALATAIEGARK